MSFQGGWRKHNGTPLVAAASRQDCHYAAEATDSQTNEQTDRQTDKQSAGHCRCVKPPCCGDSIKWNVLCGRQCAMVLCAPMNVRLTVVGAATTISACHAVTTATADCVSARVASSVVYTRSTSRPSALNVTNSATMSSAPALDRSVYLVYC